MIRSIFACIVAANVAMVPAVVVAQTVPQQSAAPVPPSAATFYRRALSQTRDHAPPSFATYAATVDGLDCRVEDSQHGLSCGLKLSGHSQTKEPLQVSYRTSDDGVVVEQQGRSYVVGDSLFLNATWRGVDEFIRWGFFGKPAPKPQSAAAIDPQTHLPVIAVVSSLSADAYRVDDAGAANCSNGDVGHMVHLTALRDPLRYPVSAAVVNMRTGDLCMVRFGARVYSLASVVGANGVAELDLADENGYEMVRDEHIAINLRAAGVAVKHIDIGIAFSNYAFPKVISPVVFATPRPSPDPSPRTIVSPEVPQRP